MNTETSKIADISPELLLRYVEMRRRVDVEAHSIHSLTSMIALLENCGDDTLSVDPVALGKTHQMLNTNILNIWEILEDFISIVRAELELEPLDKNGNP